MCVIPEIRGATFRDVGGDAADGRGGRKAREATTPPVKKSRKRDGGQLPDGVPTCFEAMMQPVNRVVCRDQGGVLRVHLLVADTLGENPELSAIVRSL